LNDLFEDELLVAIFLVTGQLSTTFISALLILCDLNELFDQTALKIPFLNDLGDQVLRKSFSLLLVSIRLDYLSD